MSDAYFYFGLRPPPSERLIIGGWFYAVCGAIFFPSSAWMGSACALSGAAALLIVILAEARIELAERRLQEQFAIMRRFRIHQAPSPPTPTLRDTIAYIRDEMRRATGYEPPVPTKEPVS